MNMSFSYANYLFLLLLAPDLHYELMGKELGEEHLCSDGRAADGNVLALLHIAQCACYNLVGCEEFIVVNDGIVVNRTVKEFGFYPTGTYSHYLNPSVTKLYAQRAGEVKHICLACAVHINVWHRLP